MNDSEGRARDHSGASVENFQLPPGFLSREARPMSRTHVACWSSITGKWQTFEAWSAAQQEQELIAVEAARATPLASSPTYPRASLPEWSLAPPHSAPIPDIKFISCHSPGDSPRAS
ncbi:hypothetical protein AB1N83_003790 [Pleurotus pulmonarius]